MTSETLNTADQLRRLIADGRVSEAALQAFTGITSDALMTFLRDAPFGTPGISRNATSLSADEGMRLSTLAAQLTQGLTEDDDFRVKAIVEVLMAQCRLTAQNIALLTGIELSQLESFLSDPDTVPVQTKYELAVRAAYLINAANAARS
ncbi:hypothetical protein HII28_19485 [Planctomonas sp. JC2975]|uniref:HTH domain-containing protein n=1 Tax=Planctomonas sp. JC2975 TaxID=2729626 RepID=UPI001473D932|nr:HTH domain-containing protein [Planctomonas sp. JC2975]NNC14046.1 hypothetical protein [Planctomonas sp. JC2975]